MTLLLALVACVVALPVTAWAAESVSYLDEKGKENVASADAVTSGMVEWSAEDGTEHWYVVRDEVTIDQRVTVKGDVHLILADDASLTVNGGINVVDGDSLSIYGQTGGTGKLVADAGFVIYYAGYAGIGSGNEETGGTVTITGGTVVAKGGSDSAGIGGGAYGSGGTVTIAGGTVTATGGFYGAGIGGGYQGSGGTVTITGGTVTAMGASGSGIGAGLYGSDGGVFFTGEGCDAAIFASSEYDKAISDNDDKTGWSGVIFEGNTGKVYGSKVTLAENFTVPEGSTLTIPAGSTLEIPEDVTLTISTGATLAVSEDATVRNAGSITGAGTVSGEGSLQLVDNGSVSVATCTVAMYTTGVAYIDEKGDSAKTAADVQVGVIGSGTTALTDGWYVAKGNVELNQRVTMTGKVHLILADGAKLTVNGGINVAGDNSLSIYGQEQGSGKLIADVGTSSQVAGIGGDSNGSAGTIVIAGGDVTVTGGLHGAGIGGGFGGSVGTITITGGAVTARGGFGGAGIGSGASGSGGTITISGGTVTATGGNGGAGIGNGNDASAPACTVTITGGTVTAQGGSGGSGIGGGSGVYAPVGTVTITGGTVTAQGGSGGAGIGCNNYSESDGGAFSTGEGGHAVIFASSVRGEAISDQNGKDSWSGVIFEDGVGKVCGSDVIPTEDFTIPADHALTVPEASGLTIAEGVTMTNEGSVELAKGCTFTNNGSLVNDGTFTVKVGAQASGTGPIGGAVTIAKAVQQPRLPSAT